MMLLFSTYRNSSEWISGKENLLVVCQKSVKSLMGTTGGIAIANPSVEYCFFIFMLSGRILRNIGDFFFLSYTGATSENTDFHVSVA